MTLYTVQLYNSEIFLLNIDLKNLKTLICKDICTAAIDKHNYLCFYNYVSMF